VVTISTPSGSPFCSDASRCFTRSIGLRVFAETHDDVGTDDLALAVQVGDTAADLRPGNDIGDILELQGYAVLIEPQRNPFQAFDAVEIAAGRHHVLGFSHFDNRRTGFLVTHLDGHLDHADRQVVGAQAIGIDHDLVLLDHAAKGGDFGYAGHCLQFILEKEILQAAQLADVVPAATIDQCVTEHPADAGRIRSELRLRGFRQGSGNLAQVLQHP